MVAKKGPPSALKGGAGSEKEVAEKPKGQRYSVQVHTNERGLEVIEVHAETGDEAAAAALKKHGYKDTSVRGVTPVSDPDPNSLGGERDAAAMIGKANQEPVNPLGTAANAEASEKLAKADISELKA